MRPNIDGEGGEQLKADDCQRVERGEGQPRSYDKTECVDCTNWNCQFMPPEKYEEWQRDEMDTLFPNGGANEGYDPGNPLGEAD